MLNIKEQEEKKILGNYHYYNMKKLDMTLIDYQNYIYEKEQSKKNNRNKVKFEKINDYILEAKKFKELEKEMRNVKKELGYYNYRKMVQLNMTPAEFLEYKKKKEEEKIINSSKKDKVRYKTNRFLERHCNLKIKCQICGSSDNIEMHHPNYDDYLKVNTLCKEHHTKLHKFELIPPPIIDLREIKKNT